MSVTIEKFERLYLDTVQAAQDEQEAIKVRDDLEQQFALAVQDAKNAGRRRKDGNEALEGLTRELVAEGYTTDDITVIKQRLLGGEPAVLPPEVADEQAGEPEDEALEDYTKAELLDMAAELGLEMTERATKAEIIEAIHDAE